MRKITRKGLKNKCDKLFSGKVRETGFCELKYKDHINCGGVLQCAHILTRGHHAIRWNFNNALCLCQGHHVWYTNNPNAWKDIVARLFPAKWGFVQKHQNEIWDKDLDKVLQKLQ